MRMGPAASFRKRVLVGIGALALVTLLYCGLCEYCRYIFETAPEADRARAWAILILRWGWIPFIATSTAIIWYLIVQAISWECELKKLCAAIRSLRTGGEGASQDQFGFVELHDCASDLAEVHVWLRQERGRLAEYAGSDELTGLPNRRTMKDALAREVAASVRTGWPISVIMLDLDHFKRLNDTYGHPAGDIVLRRAASRMASLVRQADMAARYGGEEFAIILPRADIEQATSVAQQVRDALRSDRIMIGEAELHISASLGVAELHWCNIDDPDALIHMADQALYQAKELGRDRVVAAPRAAARNATDTTAGTESSGDPSVPTAGTRVNSDTMLLMGSTFSMLRMIPDKHRVAHDALQQIASALCFRQAWLYGAGPSSGNLVSLASYGVSEFDGETHDVEIRLAEWVRELSESDGPLPERTVEPTVCEIDDGDGGTSVCVRIPLVADTELLGVIELRDPTAVNVDEALQQRSLLSAICLIGARALQICDLFQETMQCSTSLVESLANVIHGHDNYKRHRAARVGRLSVQIAQSMGQTNDESLHIVRLAGLLQDIGNIGVPGRIWEKKRKLRDNERDIVRRHCELGAEMIRTADGMDHVADIILHHHENYDGTGYPDGLAGNEIPIESRIIAVAGAFDAMTSDRPYRAAMPADTALQRILSASGSQFDPVVCHALADHIQSDRLDTAPLPATSLT